jgi:hypothetical protein
MDGPWYQSRGQGGLIRQRSVDSSNVVSSRRQEGFHSQPVDIETWALQEELVGDKIVVVDKEGCRDGESRDWKHGKLWAAVAR